MQIGFYGGVNEIGGNKIAIIANNGKGILCDFGYAFKLSQDYLDDFLKLRHYQHLWDGLILKELPLPTGNLHGIYREDLFTYIEKDMESFFHLKPAKPTIITEVIISHGHADHVGLVKYLHPEIRIILSKITYDLLNLEDDLTSSNSIFSEILEYKPFTEQQTIKREVTTLMSHQSVNCAENGLQITFYETDHSIPGAGAYLIEDLETHEKILYTGDIRMHGPNAKKTRDFIEEMNDFRIDGVLIEGTRIKNGKKRENLSSQFSHCVSESEVENVIENYILGLPVTESPKFLGFTCSQRDVWRLNSFYKVARSLNRILVLEPRSYALFGYCAENDIIEEIDMTKIKVILQKKSTGTYLPKDYSNSPGYSKLLVEDQEDLKKRPKYKYFNMEKDIFIRSEMIRDNLDEYLVQVSYFNLVEFFDIFPPNKHYDAHFILSQSEPYDPEGEIRSEKFQNWLLHFGIQPASVFSAHCSGHASTPDLLFMLRKINARKVFPIHTETPLEFRELISEDPTIQSEIILPELNKLYTL